MDNDKEFLKGNELIDFFMGSKGEYISHKDQWGSEILGNYNPNSYNSNWNLLMPVVSKIINYTAIGNNFFKPKSNIFDALSTINIQHVYNSVVEFIKWYNKNIK